MQDRPEGCISYNPPVSEIQKVCQIPVERPSIRVLLPLLRAFSSSSGFTMLLKVPISLLKKLHVRIIIYLNDMLLMASSLEDLLMARDTLIFILQHLGFLINLLPRANIDFRISQGDSRFWRNDFEPSQEKLLKVQNHCRKS